MDLLQGYEASDEEEEDSSPARPAEPPGVPPNLVPQQMQMVLPPPDWGDEPAETLKDQDMAGSGGRKRNLNQVTGASLLPTAAGSLQSPRYSAAGSSRGAGPFARTAPQAQPAVVNVAGTSIPRQLIPPQARGRANISTEEVDVAAEQQQKLKAARVKQKPAGGKD